MTLVSDPVPLGLIGSLNLLGLGGDRTGEGSGNRGLELRLDNSQGCPYQLQVKYKFYLINIIEIYICLTLVTFWLNLSPNLSVVIQKVPILCYHEALCLQENSQSSIHRPSHLAARQHQYIFLFLKIYGVNSTTLVFNSG